MADSNYPEDKVRPIVIGASPRRFRYFLKVQLNHNVSYRPVFYYNMRPFLQKSLHRTLFSPQRRYHASVLPSLVSTSSPEFVAKAAAMDELVKSIDEKMATARRGGGQKAAERMRSKGKKLPRERC